MSFQINFYIYRIPLQCMLFIWFILQRELCIISQVLCTSKDPSEIHFTTLQGIVQELRNLSLQATGMMCVLYVNKLSFCNQVLHCAVPGVFAIWWFYDADGRIFNICVLVCYQFLIEIIPLKVCNFALVFFIVKSFFWGVFIVHHNAFMTFHKFKHVNSHFVFWFSNWPIIVASANDYCTFLVAEWESIQFKVCWEFCKMQTWK